MSGSDKRLRELREEERSLWQDIARSIKPLRRSPPRKDAQTEAATDKPAAAKRKAVAAAPLPLSPAIAVRAPAPKPLAPMDRRTRQRLVRGRAEIEARLDLHGMTQTQAHAALARFLRRAQDDGCRFVLVVTGKGARGEGGARGVLRQQVPHWLALAEFRDVVLGFETAHVGHGGEGALYVRLRKRR
ncbi:MAG TPA: Smr/MutS family protein [Xanthobacteraceae bacterium]|nr:Smr/MutS family protein [Xanthobacteraceae bacterium]